MKDTLVEAAENCTRMQRYISHELSKDWDRRVSIRKQCYAAVEAEFIKDITRAEADKKEKDAAEARKEMREKLAWLNEKLKEKI